MLFDFIVVLVANGKLVRSIGFYSIIKELNDS